MTQDLETRVRPPPQDRSAQPGTQAERLLAVVDELAAELNPARKRVAASLDSRLDRDLGFDSLGRAELLFRVERALGVTLPERLLGEAETPRDLLAAALAGSGGTKAARPPSEGVAAAPIAAGEPLDVATLCELLDWHEHAHGDRVHIALEHAIGAGPTLTYAALAEKARRCARGLRERGVTPGDRIALMLPTSEAFFITFFAVLYAGAVPVPIYPPARPRQLEEHLRRQAGILGNAGASVLIAPPEMRIATRLLRSLVESVSVVVDADELLAGADGPLPRMRETGATALLQYTSGSTGAPKGVVLTHANLLANIRAMGEALEASSNDVFVSWLPLYHDMGLIGAWLGSLYYAAPLVVMPPQTFLARPERWLWAIHRHRGTLSAAPNFAFELCLKRLDDTMLEGLDLSSLRAVANGSEPVSAATIGRFAERFARYGFQPGAMAPVYGLAENAVGLAFPPPRRPPVIDRVSRTSLTRSGLAEPATGEAGAIDLVGCGRPLPGHEIRIVDDTGRELGERHEGRLQFRGPSATRGYYRNEAKTRELFSGDWLESGDLAYIAGGDVFITGRSKDIIIRAGRHIYPSEIEEAVGDLPGTRKGCVVAFGSHDRASGTERLVILAETRLSEDASRAELRGRIVATVAAIIEAPPEEVVLVSPRTIPKTSSGKLRRTAARELYEAGTLERPAAAPWRQVLDLLAIAVMPRTQRLIRAARAYLFAAYWWTVVGLIAPIAWLLIVILPQPSGRWAALRASARALFRLTGSRFDVTGRGALPEGAIVVCNHASYVDGLALALALGGELRFVAKRELVRKPIARLALQALGTLFVERGDLEQSVEDAEAAASAARSGGRLVFFAEGTLTRVPGLMPFKLGAFAAAAKTGRPVIPVALRGTRSILRGDQWFPRPGRVTVAVGDALTPEGPTLADAARLRDAARAVVLQLCGEPDLATP